MKISIDQIPKLIANKTIAYPFDFEYKSSLSKNVYKYTAIGLKEVRDPYIGTKLTALDCKVNNIKGIGTWFNIKDKTIISINIKRKSNLPFWF